MSTVNDLPISPTTIFNDFANSGVLPPNYTVVRSSSGTYYDDKGKLRIAGINEPRFNHDPITGEPLGLLAEGSAINHAPLYSNWVQNIDPNFQIHGDIISGIDDDGAYTDIINPSEYEGVFKRIFYGELGEYIGKKYTFSTEIELISTSDEVPKVLIAVGETLDYPIFAHLVIDIKNGLYYQQTAFDNLIIKQITPTRWYISITSLPAVESTIVDNITTVVYPVSSSNTHYRIRRPQFEEGGFASSYIPTTDVSAARAADAILYEHPLHLKQGTVVCKFTATNKLDFVYFTLYNKTNQANDPIDYRRILAFANSDRLVHCGIYGAGTSDTLVRHDITGKIGGYLTGAVTWDTDTIAAGLEGVTSTFNPEALNDGYNMLKLGNSAGDSYSGTTHIKKLFVFPEKVDIETLARLTE